MQSEAAQFDDWDDDKIEKHVAKLMKSAVAGLADLDKEGFLGKAVGVSVAGDVVAVGDEYQTFAWKHPGFAPLLAKRVGKYQGSHWAIHTLALSRGGGELAIGGKSLFNADGGNERRSILPSTMRPF